MWGGGEQSFLSQPHHNSALQCQLWMWKELEASYALHNHKKVCLGFAKKPTAGSGSKPSSDRGGDGNQGSGFTKATPKKKDSKAPAPNSQGQSHRHKPHRDSKSKKDSSSNRKKKKDASPTRKGSGHKVHKDGSRC